MNKTCGISLNLISFIGCVLTCSAINTPRVRVDSGDIAGGLQYTYNGRQIYSFLGIPYARSPVQNYQFKVCYE